ncbi:MAG TPA: MFS transporter [Candidatus Paceibacterota bacterium]|nr:MFS transporter [Candidatus Paceibacterota bacterium]
MRKPSLIVIFLTVFIDLIGFGIVMPILPLYSERFGANGLMIGFIIASFSVMQFIFSPIWGRLSDRYGRRPILLISLAGSAISYALFGWASMLAGPWGLWLILASRTFAGICGGNITVAQAYIADITPPNLRSARMGLVGLAFGLGFILGPAIGALSTGWGISAPGWLAAGLCGSNFVLACIILPESWKPSSEHVPSRPSLAQGMRTLRETQVGLLIFLFFVATFCFACYETTLALLVYHAFDYNQTHVGYLFAFGGLISAVVQGGLIRRLVNRWGEPALICGSFFMLGLSLAALPYCRNNASLLLSLAVLAFGSSINRPPTFGLISNLTVPAEQGVTLGVAQSAGSLARIFGPIFSAALFDLQPALPYVACGAIALAAGGIAWHLLSRYSPQNLPESKS